jgi:hypothetical protein
MNSWSGVLCRPATLLRKLLWRQRVGPCQSSGDRWDWYSPDVMDGVVAHFALDSGGASDVREFGEKVVDRCTATDGLDAGGQWAGRH